MTSTTPLVALAQDVSQQATVISEFLAANNFTQPSVTGDADYSPDLPPEIEEARRKLREAAKAIEALAAGPAEHLRWLSWSYHDVSSFMWIHRYRIAASVPLQGSISFAALAEATQTHEPQLRRILRYAMLNLLFIEDPVGHVAHSPSSRLLVTDKMSIAWTGYVCDECAPAAFQLVQATEKWGGADEDGNHAPYQLAHQTELSRYAFHALPENKQRAERFADLMTAFTSTPGWSIKHTVHGYDWASISGTIVDVGGSTGGTAIALATAYPHLKFVVEDFGPVVEQGREALPEELRGKVSFVEYNALEVKQPVKEAELYLMRFLCHDFSDKDCVKLLRNTVSAMGQGSKLVVIDSVIPPPKTLPPGIEKGIRTMDLEMMNQFNAQERELGDWMALFSKVDGRVTVKSIHQPPGSVMSVIELALEG